MSSLSSLSGSGAISFTGLATGIDTDKLVEAALRTYDARIDNLRQQQTKVATEQTTFKGIEARLLGLQTQITSLARSVNSVFDGKTVTSSNEDSLQAAASSTATSGIYTLQVSQLAQAHQVASGGVADTGAALKQGSLQIQVGSGATTTITVDGSNNTLQGLAAAINNSGADVHASIVNDGSSTPYRLLLSAKETGEANQIQIVNNLTTGTGVDLDLDPTTGTIQAAADAELVVGSGPGALVTHNASNTVDQLINGVTLQLKSTTSSPITITVGSDTKAAEDTIGAFVTSYNDLIDFINEQSTYDPQTQEAGVLLGSRESQELADSLAGILSGGVSGASPSVNRLSAIGLRFDDKGKLQLDSQKLQEALKGDSSGSGLADLKKLFAFTGASSHTQVSFVLGGSKVKVPPTPIGVNITQVAEQATLTGLTPLAATTTINSANNELTLTLNGRTATVTLTDGDYTAAELAEELQAQIDGDESLSGAGVTVSLDSGSLQLRTGAYGTSAKITIDEGSALTDLGLGAGQAAAGLNVAGTFVIDGVEEAATGTGQLLAGSSGNAFTDGLQLRVTLTADQLGAGSEAELTLSRGLASQVGRVLDNYLDPVTGRLKTIDQSFQDTIEGYDDQIERQNESRSFREAALSRQLAAMEAAVGQIKATGDLLTAQLASLASLNTKK